MTVDTNNEGWVYVFVGKSGEEEDILGLYDEETSVNFIPAFHKKEEAEECFLALPRAKGKRYEVQAVHLEELRENASKNDFVVAMVDKDGKILK